MIPGDPATAILGSYATPENVARLNRDLGLDRPAVQRYFIWLGNMLQGDFGTSFSRNRPVLDEVLERFNATLILAGTAFGYAFAGVASSYFGELRQNIRPLAAASLGVGTHNATLTVRARQAASQSREPPKPHSPTTTARPGVSCAMAS